MAGMRALGRVYDVINPNSTVATAVAFSVKDCSAFSVIATNTSTAQATVGFSAATSYAGTYTAATTANGFGQPNTWYLRNDSTASWTKQTANWNANALTVGTTANQVAVVDYLCSELADTYDYVKLAPTNCTIVVLKYDLTVQRKPDNLKAPSA